MTYTKESKRPLDEIEPRLRAAAQAHKFGVLNVLDIQQTLKSKGIELERACKIFDVCNPQAASQALNTDMRVSVVLPCRISAYASDGGTTLATIHPKDPAASHGHSRCRRTGRPYRTRVGGDHRRNGLAQNKTGTITVPASTYPCKSN